MKNRKVLLFDGVCNFCNGTVQFVLKHDKKAVFKFASLQSDAGQQILAENSLPLKDFDSFVYVDGDKVYLKSTAALHVLKELGGLFRLSFVLIVIPRPGRDYVYSILAKNRYKWFGKKDACTLPSPETRERFL
ncbi:thiol-disulfide oxidoreductase DCC family protein [Peribacillus frigoritolerans]|uniref:thiol-disulfide oxidoreductase DCC family protein n=1 Tax=Peribacillus frigoritolerans TaxID=450367 RepID=UPI00105A1B71|nr:thiol-disulfide oxidoreductase DCC family protein [Peribacillus frigoritolerans]TDL78604.1 thiol-disulfide oxidoreductase DCC family protein [Peribacillus frigoritolerans]